MTPVQPGILAPIPPAGRFLTLGLVPGADTRRALSRLSQVQVGEDLVIGLGDPLVRSTGVEISALRAFPALAGPGVMFPSTQGALWILLRGQEHGALLLRARALIASLGEAFRVDEDVATFKHDGGRDLSGFVDGTENPEERAEEVAVTASGGPGHEGSSFVAVQRWVHDLARLGALSEHDRDLVIGRRLRDNEEIEDAPATAHVKRTAQEDFDPEAFLLRRSMPYGGVAENGLYFVAYGATLDAFERQLTRMSGAEDGIVDALLGFSRAVTGGYYWCPPLREGGHLDLRAIRS
jgi:putative iron-dependent peroxidase